MPQYRAASRHSWHWRFASLDRGGPTRSRSSPCSDPPQGQRRCCFTLTYSGIILKKLSGAHFFEDPASRLCLRFRRVPESHSASIWDSSSSHGVSPNISRIPTRVNQSSAGSRNVEALQSHTLFIGCCEDLATPYPGGHWTRLNLRLPRATESRRLRAPGAECHTESRSRCGPGDGSRRGTGERVPRLH